MILVIEKNSLSWENAEKKELSIPYIDMCGVQRTYRADFLIEGKVLVEVKPKRLMSTPNNILKKEAAAAFCKVRGLEYEIVDVDLISVEDVVELHSGNLIKFTKKFEGRIEDLKCKVDRIKLRSKA